ncbi:MAG: bifunctional acetate--CoA ligase family protein/GNAT family N-acetyltransferase [Planctomycetota bacterium]
MTVRHLEHLLRPTSIAVVGASNRPQSVGATVMRNLLHGGFAGPILPVNPNSPSVCGVLAYRSVAELPMAPDLAVVCTPAATVPDIVATLAERGTRAAAIISAGFREAAPELRLSQRLLDAARPKLMRLLGPNSVGLLVPPIGMNASFAHANALSGNLAFVSQSGGMCTAVLDWARSRGIGFSHFLSLGDALDVDFGDLVDYLGADPATSGILLYIESIRNARKFLSAARAASRNKPVIAIKAGRAPGGARAAASHTGALAGSDLVYDAALRRAGILRVHTIEELFDTVETIARARPSTGARLAIVTNGGGPGVLAADELTLQDGVLAELSPTTLAALEEQLPSSWSRGNPVDVVGDASAERYARTLRVLLDDPGVDGLLVLHCPTAVVSAADIAREVATIAQSSHKTLLTSWIGEDSVRSARAIFDAMGVPSYHTPEDAVRAFQRLAAHDTNQALLRETPPTIDVELSSDPERARNVLASALSASRPLLNEIEAKEVLSAYGIAVVPTRLARTTDEAVLHAEALGYPVVLKVQSPQISHRSDVGGVALDLASAEAVRLAARELEDRLRRARPDAAFAGYLVEPMVGGRKSHELILGINTDAVFGPVLLFGHGGTAVEVIRDQVIGLPPLNVVLAQEMIRRTRVWKLLRGYRDRPPVDERALCLTLVRLSQLVLDRPEVAELDINPLLVDEHGVVAVDARIRVAAPADSSPARLAILPYPRELEEWVELGDLRVLLRPIRPQDEASHAEFLSRLDPDDVRFRFFRTVRALPHSQLARYTQIDYDREMAFIATIRGQDAKDETLGVVRCVFDPSGSTAEFAIIVLARMKGKGLGAALLQKLIGYCRNRGAEALVGQVLTSNVRMLNFVRGFGFEIESKPEQDTVEVRLRLGPA